MKRVDAAIIGFGKGGKTLAGELAKEGWTVAMVERSDKMYGGTCINVGCIPSKSLVYHAQLSAQQGGDFTQRARRYREAIEEKRKLTTMLRRKNYDKLAQNPNVTVLTGKASFIDQNRIRVETDSGTEEIQAKQIFVNTGSRPFLPPISGLAESRFAYTSEGLLDLAKLPEKLVIIGGGYIGMEFASIYTNFGSKVTVIQDGPAFLPREDEEIAQAVLDSLERRGVTVLRSTLVQAVIDGEDGAALEARGKDGAATLHADAILVAAGRRPETSGLAPERAGIRLNERGAVQVDENLRTSAGNIWAMGDVVGGLQFTYISLDDFRIVKSQVLDGQVRNTKNRGAVPYSVFLDPPFSRVGLSEREAREQGYEVKIARLPAAAVPKARVLRQTEGVLKAVVDAKTGEILGAHLFCAESHEMINLIKLAMDARLPYTALRDAVYTHPTMSEALNDLFSSLE